MVKLIIPKINYIKVRFFWRVFFTQNILMVGIRYFWFKTVFLKGLELVSNKGSKPMQNCLGTNIS